MRDYGERVRAVLQRVSSASVEVDGVVVGAIDGGLLILLGIAAGDGEQAAVRLAEKVVRMRIFDDDEGRFERSLLDVGGAALVVSQFTLLADVRKGTRPSFGAAERPELAGPLVERFCDALRALGAVVETGRFGARMAVSLVNDGPVTVVVDLEGPAAPRRDELEQGC